MDQYYCKVKDLKEQIDCLLDCIEGEKGKIHEEDKMKGGADDTYSEQDRLLESKVLSKIDPYTSKAEEHLEAKNVAKNDPVYSFGIREITDEQRNKMLKGANDYRNFVKGLKSHPFLKNFKGKGIRTIESVLYELSNDLESDAFNVVLDELEKNKPKAAHLKYGLNKIIDDRKRLDLLEAPKLRKAVKRVFN